jgi:hypothetical protein
MPCHPNREFFSFLVGTLHSLRPGLAAAQSLEFLSQMLHIPAVNRGRIQSISRSPSIWSTALVHDANSKLL